MLGAEEKRWLVVGICLSKVLTPVLRNVIAADMQELFKSYILPPTKIHLQTFDSHSKTLFPSELRLNYANINNNASKGSPNNYDYSVRDEVSLAKLFVKPAMAGFTAFDESLDLSAALYILCGAPNFVFCAVDLIAIDVRLEVRNEWGHCKFAMWTETYYNRCFQLMEDLIKKLTHDFPVFSEGEVLEDLKEWKNRGIEMCFDQSINNDVLKLVQDEMATLVKSVEDNKETWVQDHEGLRTNLQNIQQLFGIEIKNLEAKHTALQSGLQRLESRHELLETRVTGLSQGKEDEKDFLKSGLLWQVSLAVIFVLFNLIILSESDSLRVVLGYWYNQQGTHSKMVSAVVLLVFLLIFLYEHYTKGSMLRYWYCRRGCLKGGRTLSFVYTTHDHQTPKVNGLEFTWENLKKKMNLNFEPRDVPGTHYYINTDRYAYGGVIAVRSLLDNTPQVRGAEVFAVNADCTTVYYEQDGTWRPYISARDIRCISPNTY